MRIAACALVLLTAACAGLPDTRPVNTQLTAIPPLAPVIDLANDDDAIALALSGGGARAASFSLGVLEQLRDIKAADGKSLISKVSLVTAVSGGAITAAWFGRHGAEGLDEFRAALLDKDWQSELHTTFVSPQNWDRFMQGGLNGPDKLSNWLDKEVFSGAHMSDLKATPQIIINATDLYSGAPFAFARPWFDAICADLPNVRLSDAVAASMSVPIAFRPIVLEAFSTDCPAPLSSWIARTETDRSAPLLLRETARSFRFYRDPERMKYVHLTDGGVADNFGVSSLVTLRAAANTPFAPFSAHDAVKLRRFTFLIINAERDPEGAWALKEGGPDGTQMIETALSIAVNAPKRAAADALRDTLKTWKSDTIAWRCALTPEEAEQLGAGAGWDCRDLEVRLDMISFADLKEPRFARLGQAATAVSLPRDQIDDLIAGGRRAIAQNPEILRLMQ
jgi:NTE family protein